MRCWISPWLTLIQHRYAYSSWFLTPLCTTTHFLHLASVLGSLLWTEEGENLVTSMRRAKRSVRPKHSQTWFRFVILWNSFLAFKTEEATPSTSLTLTHCPTPLNSLHLLPSFLPSIHLLPSLFLPSIHPQLSSSPAYFIPFSHCSYTTWYRSWWWSIFRCLVKNLVLSSTSLVSISTCLYDGLLTPKYSNRESLYVVLYVLQLRAYIGTPLSNSVFGSWWVRRAQTVSLSFLLSPTLTQKVCTHCD